MQEVCFCGRTGPVIDRSPQLVGSERALICPDCGNVEFLRWWNPEHLREQIWEQAVNRALERAAADPPAETTPKAMQPAQR
ncbi:hypothetical protein WEH80_36915 [Actinomycetes bacterium KLBMP 9759]